MHKSNELYLPRASLESYERMEVWLGRDELVFKQKTLKGAVSISKLELMSWKIDFSILLR